MGEPAVVVDGLSESYRRRSGRRWRRQAGRAHWALRDISFSVNPGELLGVIGANGSGKSTLLLCIAGVVPPTSGVVQVGGRVASLIDLTAGIHRELTGRENVRISCVLSGLTRAEAKQREGEIAAFSGLDDDALDSPLRTYSAGMGLRLGFSVVVHTDPQVLLIDEVLAVGDEGFQTRCVERVEELRQGGTAVVLVSHDLELVARIADRIALLDDGHLAFLGDPVEAVDRYVAACGGTPDRQDFSFEALHRVGQRQLKRRARGRR